MDETPTQSEVNEYLNALRDSGEVIMKTAAPCLEVIFGVDKKTARKLLRKWMENNAP